MTFDEAVGYLVIVEVAMFWGPMVVYSLMSTFNVGKDAFDAIDSDVIADVFSSFVVHELMEVSVHES